MLNLTLSATYAVTLINNDAEVRTLQLQVKKTMVKIGQRAPDFTLPSTMGDPVTLSKEIGNTNIVLAFYYLNWTPVCHGEMCSFRDDLSNFEKEEARVYGISVDSPFAQKAWAKELGLTYPLLSDFNREASRAYDVLYQENRGLKEVSKRSVFIINKKGNIAYTWVTEDPKIPPKNTEILAKLKSLK